MPACMTHHLFAKEVLSRLEAPAADPCAYYWGAQGPDFLFCHRYFYALTHKESKTLNQFGSALHKSPPSQTLGAMRDFLKQHENPSYRSYVLGFLCHYALDSTAHPFVNARAQEMAQERPAENPQTMHGEIEASLDAIILRWQTGMLPSQVPLKTMFPKNEGVQRKIACLYKEVLFQVYGAQVSEEDLYQSTKDAHFVFACCTDRTGLKRRAFHILEQGRPHCVTSHLVPITEDPDIDFANMQHIPWTWQGETRDRDFFQLYGEALDLAVRLGGGLDTVDFAEATGERPFG